MEKQQVFYVHGGSAFSDYQAFLSWLQGLEIRDLPGGEETPQRWSKTLAADLGDDFEVFAPQMPGSMNAQYLEWKIWFERYFPYLHDGVILVGWSLGGTFLTKYLLENTVPFRIEALFLLAAVYGDGSLVSEDGEDGGDFMYDVNRLPELADRVGKITLLHSEDDFVVPFEHVQKYATALPQATVVTFTDRNHFLQPELPELLEMIHSVAK